VLEFTVSEGSIRLDKYVVQQCGGISRSYAQQLIDEGRVTVNKKVAKASTRLEAGDRVNIELPPPTTVSLMPEEMELKIVYEDDDLLVIDKPAGLAVHPGAGRSSHTLANALLARYPELSSVGGSLRPGIVHRLDKDTSGLMMVAKNDVTQASLSNQLKARSVVKNYLALVTGHLSPQSGAIEAPIGRDPHQRKRMAVVGEGKEARTVYRVIRYMDDYTLVEVILETGRTHQIRVHLSAIGHPVAGDAVYGKRVAFLARPFLHAATLGFVHPRTGQYMEFQSELPEELADVLERVAAPHPDRRQKGEESS